MKATAIKQVSNKLKDLPDALLEEVEKYIDFLAFKHHQEHIEIPQWQKDIVLERMKNPKGFVDAFEMLDKIESKK